MNKNLICKLAFSFALIAVILVAGASISMAQIKPGGVNTCPTNACPANLSGYTHTGSCTTTSPHCPSQVLQCNVWELNGSSCYDNCGWQ